MKKAKKIMSIVAVFLLLLVSNAYSAPVDSLFNIGTPTLLSDNSADLILNVDGSISNNGSPTVTAGDILVTILGINTIGATTIGAGTINPTYNEVTAITVVKISSGPNSTFNNPQGIAIGAYTAMPLTAADTAWFDWSTGIIDDNGPAPGGNVYTFAPFGKSNDGAFFSSVYEDAANNYTRDNTIQTGLSFVTDGSIRLLLGIVPANGDYLQVLGPVDLGSLLTLPPSTNVNLTNISFDGTILTQSWPGLNFNANITGGNGGFSTPSATSSWPVFDNLDFTVTAVSASCGDGIVGNTQGETCDPPGSTPDPSNPGNTCRDNCTYCGDGIQNNGEVCDFNDPNAPANCNTACTLTPICGDGIVGNTQGETCDPPQSVPNPTYPNNICRDNCTFCGDGIVNNGEVCDFNDPNAPANCNTACNLTPICGDGIVGNTQGETCDPPGSTPDLSYPNNTCRDNCTYCGDGVVNNGEVCDFNDPNAPANCNTACTITPVCGDGIVGNTAGETCDPPGSTPDLSYPNNTCRDNCTYCGDGVVNNGEVCDFNDPNAPANCNTSCTLTPICGDGIVGNTQGETCDPPGSSPDPSHPENICRDNCTYCGDGIRNNGEECDFIASPDNCNSDCTFKEFGGCRMTGGHNTVSPDGNYYVVPGDSVVTKSVKSNNKTTTFKYTVGGQIGAPQAGCCTPGVDCAPGNGGYGEWEHSHHENGILKFSFHAGTHSAPADSYIQCITCADPGWCVNARCAPFKQIFWEGTGIFQNPNPNNDSQFTLSGCKIDPVAGKSHSLHYYKAHVGDFGEPGNTGKQKTYDPNVCHWTSGGVDVSNVNLIPAVEDEKFGYKGGQACESCPDWYEIEVHCNANPASPIIYRAAGYLTGGNHQLHPAVSDQCMDQ